MNSNVSLIILSQKTHELILKKIKDNLSIFLNWNQFIKKIQQRFVLKHNEIGILEKKIYIDDFKKLLRSPQVNDLLKNYLYYLLTNTIIGIAIKKKCLQDEVVNYMVSIIEDHFPKLSQDESIIAIKRYFTLIFSIYGDTFDNSIYSDIVEKKNGKVIECILTESIENLRLTDNYIDHIERNLAQEYIPRNTLFESIQKKYIKALRNYYQYGFIYLLGEYKFSEFYIPPVLTNSLRSHQLYWHQIHRVDAKQLKRHEERWKHIFDNQDIVYVIGGAGYGKSLFLRNIINDYTKMNIENNQDYLLIYCDLKSYYASGDINSKTMIDFFKESMISITGTEGISKDFIQYYLNIGRCIVLLDALDEVPRDKRYKLHKKITTFFSTSHPNNKVCITSRDRGFIPQKDIEVLEILPLSEKDISVYIDKMIALGKFKKEDKDTFMSQAQVLIDKEFLNNFLVLSLLVNIYKAEKELPENKIDLYKKCFEYIAKKREEEKSKTGYDWKSIYPLMKDSTFISLSKLAAPNNKDIDKIAIEHLLTSQYKTKYSDEATAEYAINEFLEFCSNRTELFVLSSTDDKFKFFHRSFFEYFYSRYIHQQPDIAEMYKLMKDFDIDSEVFELTVALVKEDNEEKYQGLVEYIFNKAQEELTTKSSHYNAFGILTLSMQVIDDAYYIKKYYEVIIKFHELMFTIQNNSINQKLISMWVDKAICNDTDKKLEFLKTYADQCVCYLLSVLNSISINPQKQMHVVFELPAKILNNNLKTNFLPIHGTIPFYVLLYSKYGDLYLLMDGYVRSGINNLHYGSIKKSILKKGFAHYTKLSQGDRKKFCELFQ